ncbi:ProQ/FINO family protein [Roseateles saccharophilus]|uniref:ProQ/FINO family protein n=1 Tax=Roseateles saccharophilus TaxID=304 RepID=A0A4R3V2H7_ROSSA|nr:ProQ/FINO family protein [Roseateles saccharophilus]MDG0831957.1 prop effector ProQ [Roseateles saccharophilus]TCU97377.1 ProQ/FINO family protein [Roseateles saccharophilus]
MNSDLPETAATADDTPAPVPAAPAAPAENQAPARDATAELKALFPALFSGRPKPVKLRIQADIQERAPGKFTKAQLSAFLRRHTGSTGYLIALTQAKTRFDLDGNPAGEITEEHLAAAREELARRKGLQQERQQLEQERHQLEAQQRRNRGQLLWDFERTTLTEANFCVLKGLKPEELPGLLEIARRERAEAPPAPPREARRDDRRPGGGRPEGRGPRRPEQRPDGRRDQPRGDRPARGAGGRPPQPGRKPAPQQVEQPAPSQMAQALQAVTLGAKAEPAADQQPAKDQAPE